MFSSVPQKVVRQIAALTHISAPSLNLKFLNTAQQHGRSACGLCNCFCDSPLCRRRPLHLSVQSGKHPHLLRCLEAGQMTPFPSKERAVQHRVKASQHIDVHCHCRQPSYGKMIRCTVCSKWFHNKCELVSPRHWKKPASWTCSTCTQVICDRTKYTALFKLHVFILFVIIVHVIPTPVHVYL